MNPFDYRIHSRKETLRGWVQRVTTYEGNHYCVIKLADGRVLPFVRSQGIVAPKVKTEVYVTFASGRWQML